MVAADSRRARTMPVRSPLSKVMPALSMATSVPVPMAMPTSAAASAGASLTPSPAIATTRPSLTQPLDHCALLLGQHLGFDILDAEAPGDGLCSGPIVAGQHDDAHAVLRQQLESLWRGGLDRIGNRNHRGNLAVDGKEDGGGAVGAKPFGLIVQIGR